MRGDGRVSVGRGWAAGLAVEERAIVVPQAYRARAGAAEGARSETQRARQLHLQQHGENTAAAAAMPTEKRLPAFFFPPAAAGRAPRAWSPLANAVDDTYPSVARLPGVTFPDFPRYDARAPRSRGGPEAAAAARASGRARFRFRPRIGRGGRFIVDGVRVAS
jgi:hypothetical protein